MREKEIEEMAKAIFQNCNCGLFYSEAEKIARFVIEEQGYRKQSEPISCSHEKGGEWISVDERLPKQRKLVLCIWTLENGCLNNYIRKQKRKEAFELLAEYFGHLWW